MSILHPSDNLVATPNIRWSRTTCQALWYGTTPTGTTFSIERAPSATYRLWVTVNGHSTPLTTFPTTAEAATYAEGYYAAG